MWAQCPHMEACLLCFTVTKFYCDFYVIMQHLSVLSQLTVYSMWAAWLTKLHSCVHTDPPLTCIISAFGWRRTRVLGEPIKLRALIEYWQWERDEVRSDGAEWNLKCLLTGMHLTCIQIYLFIFNLNSTDIGLAHLAQWSPRIFIPEQEIKNASVWFTILYLFIDNPKRLMSKRTKIADLLHFSVMNKSWPVWCYLAVYWIFFT